jgi:Caspase domain
VDEFHAAQYVRPDMYGIVHRDRLGLTMVSFCKAFVRAGWAVAVYLAGVNAVLSQERFALVIGNDVFPGSTPLSTPAKDAFDVSAALTGLGFNVRRLRNAGREDLWATIGAIAKPDGPVLFYYSGPVFAVGGKTYLVPADFGGRAAANAADTAWPLDDIVAVLRVVTRQEVVIVLEGCHDPGAGSFSGLGRIAAPDPGSTGVFYAFSSGPGESCDPADGKRPRITEALLEGLKQPGLGIGEMFKSSDGANDAGLWTLDRLSAAFVPNRLASLKPETPMTTSRSVAGGAAATAGWADVAAWSAQTIVITAPIRPIGIRIRWASFKKEMYCPFLIRIKNGSKYWRLSG